MMEEKYNRFAELGTATVYEASGREGLIDQDLIQLLPGSSAAGPARTVLCGQDDNLMVHAVIEKIQPGDILVLTMPEPRPIALVGDLLATQIKVRGAAGVLVDAAVRDVAELAEMGLPIWTHFIRAKGAVKKTVGKIDVPVMVGGAQILPGDVLVLDVDGGVCVSQGRIDEVLKASEARLEREAQMRKKLLAGEISYDIHGLRSMVEKNGGNHES